MKGLGRRLDDNPRPDRTQGSETLPFRHFDRTYQLPIRFYVFPSGDVGARRRFVAKDHALMLNSNGQVHAHWTPSEFRVRTRLPKLADRILVVVDTDDLPLPLRTTLFTADRTELIRNDDSVRLEEEVIAFLNDWEALRTINNGLVRDAILRSNAGRSTTVVATRIAQALQVRGFSESKVSSTRKSSAQGSRQHPRPIDAFDDPTELVGPDHVEAPRGRTKGIHLRINGRDDFIPRRASPVIRCSHLDIDVETDVTVGSLRGGHLRIAIAVPPDADPCESELEVIIDGWVKTTGGLGPRMSWTTRFEVTEQAEPNARPAVAEDPMSRRNGNDADNGSRVALLWSSHEVEEEWTSSTVGDIEMVPAHVLAEADSAYEPIAGSDIEISVLKLNEGFSPLKAYASIRAKAVGDEGVARAKDRYALGVGVEMFLLEREIKAARDAGEDVPEKWLRAATAAAARGVLSVLPDFDHLVVEAGLDNL